MERSAEMRQLRPGLLFFAWLFAVMLVTPALAQNTTGDITGTTVDTARIVELPLSGRDFNSLLAGTPGVQREPGGGFMAVSISGMRHSSNNYMIDGISNNDRYYGDSVMNQVGILGVPATLVPMDAIAEFTIQQTPSAEF